MTVPLDPGLPSDKLYAPLNAPRAGNVSVGIQPGSPQVILAQYVIVFGTAGGVFIYSGSPGLGNPPVYWVGNVTADPYGNTLNEGIWAGQTGAIQVGLQAQGGSAQVFFVPVGGYAAVASAGIVQSGGQAILELLGAQTTANPAANSDRVALFLWDHGGAVGPGASADIQAWFFDTSGTGHNLWNGNYAGLGLGACYINAVQPGTGTDPTAAGVFVPETWHPVTLDAGWTAVAGYPAPQYRLLPTGDVEIAGVVSHAAFNVSTPLNNGTPLPAGYRPASRQAYRTGNGGTIADIELVSTGVINCIGQATGSVRASLGGIATLL